MAGKFGNMFNRMANFVGIVDEEDTAQRSKRRREEEERADEYRSSRQSGYTPRSRRNERTQPASRQTSRNQRGRQTANDRDEYVTSSARTPNDKRSASRKDRNSGAYSDWNSSYNGDDRYNDIYDSDTSATGTKTYEYDNSYAYGYQPQEDVGFDDNGYDQDFNSRSAQRNGRSNRAPDQEAQQRPAGYGASDVVMLDIEKMADCKVAVMSLLANKTVIISVERYDQSKVRRVEDFLLGAAFALGTKLYMPSANSYLIAPSKTAVNKAEKEIERRY